MDAHLSSSTPLTFCRVGDLTPTVGFLQFWSAWQERVGKCGAEMSPVSAGEAERTGAPGVTHLIRSLDGVRVGARVTLPEGSPAGWVIELHGYGMASEEPLRSNHAFVRRNLGHVALRVRGYPGSQIDCGDLLNKAGGYITIGLNRPEDWITGFAVADVVLAFRALRAMGGPDLPISIKGESFGGAMAILAASAIASRDSVHRLVVGVPSLGDWSWRVAHPENGSGAGAELLRVLPTDADSMAESMRTLRMFDTMVHARRVTCPVLMKLAYSDPVVDPATVAAVYNALGTGAGLKWRYMTSYAHVDPAGHSEASADLRRHAQFERLAEEFLDPREYPQTLMRRWEAELPGIRPACEE